MNQHDLLEQQLDELIKLSGQDFPSPPVMSSPKTPIREYGKVYDYLKDHKLRAREKRDIRIRIDNADFTGEEFVKRRWKDIVEGCKREI